MLPSHRLRVSSLRRGGARTYGCAYGTAVVSSSRTNNASLFHGRVKGEGSTSCRSSASLGSNNRCHGSRLCLKTILFCCLFLSQTIDVKTDRRLANQEAILVPLDKSWLPLSKDPNHHPQKLTIWRYSRTSIYVLLYLCTFDWCTVIFEHITLITYSNSIYLLHLTYSNSKYVLSKVHISNTGVRILKYKIPIELHGDFAVLVQQDWNCP
jgi:hypothetical protein